jgi:hypothetical protein
MANEMVGLTPSQFAKFMCGMFLSGDTRDNIYAEGHHGISKTEIIVQCAIAVWGTPEQKNMSVDELLRMTDDERGWVLRREYPATRNVEDYTGVPYLRDGRTIFGIPQFVPTNLKLPGVLVIEELNQATEEILKACFPFLQDRKVGDFILPNGVFLVVTGNPPNSIHHVTDFPIALKDRMQRMGFVHHAKDWIKWARGGSLEDVVSKLREKAAKFVLSLSRAHDSVISFIEDNPNMLHVIPDDGSIGPTPRAWCAVSRMVEKYEAGLIEEYMLVEAIKNRVGDKATARFIGHFKNYAKRAVTAEELLTKYEEFLPRYNEQSPAGKAESIQSVMSWMEKEVKNLTKDSPELAILSDLFTNHAGESLLMAKSMTADTDQLNILIQLGPHGVAVGKKLASIRHKAEKDKKK